MTHRLSCWCGHGRGGVPEAGAAGRRRLWGRRRTRLRGEEQGHGRGRTFDRRVPGPPLPGLGDSGRESDGASRGEGQ